MTDCCAGVDLMLLCNQLVEPPELGVYVPGMRSFCGGARRNIGFVCCRRRVVCPRLLSLSRFAGYAQPGTDKVLGDPSETGFTQMLQEDYGWKPPATPGRFDTLPLLLQANPDEAPQVCRLPQAVPCC